MKPIIGIVSRPLKDELGRSTDIVVDAFRKVIINNGGIPIGIIPPQPICYEESDSNEIGNLTTEEENILIKQIELCDGLIFQGGTRWYLYDEFICNYCIENNIPGLYICMSMQLLGKLDMQKNGIIGELVKIDGHKSNDDYVHDVIISKDSILYDIIGKERIKVNSRHNYSVPETGSLKVSARSEDNIIEAIERNDDYFALGLQWHPELMAKYDEDQNKIFRYFINKCSK